MNMNKYFWVFLVLIIYYWVICLAQSDEKLENRTKRQVQNPRNPSGDTKKCECQDLEQPKSSRNDCVICKCDCGTTAKGVSVISTIRGIVTDILKGIDLLMINFRKDFDSLALLTEIAGIYDNKELNLGPLLNGYTRVNKTVSHILEVFHNFFGGRINQTVLNPLNFMSKLNNKTTQLLRRLIDMRLPNLRNLTNIIETIQRNVNLTLKGFLQNDMSLLNLPIWRLINRIPFFPMNNGGPTIPRNLDINISGRYLNVPALIKFLTSRINFDNFRVNLRNSTMRIPGGFGAYLSRMWNKQNFTGIIPNINFMWPTNLFGINTPSNKFNWGTPISNLKNLLKSVQSIPESIVQFFKTIRETLKPSRLFKDHWGTMKTDPLFLAESCSSKLEKLYQLSRYEPPSKCDRIISKLCRYRRLSLWDKLKYKLFDHFTC